MSDNTNKKADIPEPGRVNEARTKCCCQCCEQVMDLDPSWTYRSECPHCEERIFAHSCEDCYYSQCSNDIIEPSFPNQPCDYCNQTQEEKQAEERQQERHKEEQERVKTAFEYRTRVQKGIHQNAIRHTFYSLQESDPRKVLDATLHPRNEADALRMFETTWNKLRPHVVQEIEARHLDPNTIITTKWCQRILSFFERAWLEENREGLQCGVVADHTGLRYICVDHGQLTVKLRELREGFAENGVFPCCPKVTIVQNRSDDTLTVTWDPDPEGDIREIYQLDKDRRLSLGEFILWCARFGAFDRENSKYYVRATQHQQTEPIAYLPSEWVGRPQSWLHEAQSGFRRFHFWMNDSVHDWNGRRHISSSELRSMSEANMRRCCVCYGLPPEGQDLIECECGDRLYCCVEHQDKYMKIHKFHPTLKHPSASFVCLNCGEEKTRLSRCAKCKNAFFCDKDCQKEAWNGFSFKHKKNCCNKGVNCEKGKGCHQSEHCIAIMILSDYSLYLEKSYAV